MSALFHDFAFHGGRLDLAARAHPEVASWLDLSTGINPRPWAPATMPAVDLRALPDRTALRALEAAAAAAFDAPAAAVAALPGSEVGLRLLATLDLPRPWRVAGPGYRTHHAALPGAASVAADALPTPDGGGTLLLANPNNPDGRAHDPGRLLALARGLAARGGLLVVDEAFVDAQPALGLLPRLEPADRVLVLRSFGKFYGLAGLRLGFAAGAADLVAAIRVRLGDWPVAAHAIALGTAAYRDRAWAVAARVRLAALANELDRVLGAHGLRPVGGCPLFRLVAMPDAPARFARLLRAGILVRPFEDPGRLRFGLPADARALDRLDRALADG